MNRSITSLFIGCFMLLSAWSASASQPEAVLSRNGSIVLSSIENRNLAEIWAEIPAFNGQKYFLVQFSSLPSQANFNKLNAAGLKLNAYLPHKTYIASSDLAFKPEVLLDFGLTALQAMPVEMKIDPDLLKPKSWRPLEKEGKKVLVQIEPQPGVNTTELQRIIWQTADFSPAKSRTNESALCGFLHPADLKKVAAHPAVLYIEPSSPEGEPEDREGRSLHRSHTIDNELMGGRRYSGSGIIMGIADDGAIGPHIDFTGRVTQYTTNFNLGNTHGDMVAGIAVGAANLDPTKKGMAPGTYLHMYGISGYPHVVPAVANYTNLGTTITSTSYSEVNGGLYNGNAATVDDQIRDNTMLMHVFSAGNAGTANHGYGAGAGWGNITGGYKAAKNVMAVANLRNTDQLENSSSRGPARDGRIKPDIAANGFQQLSTGPNNTYLVGGGTSAASPGIAGIYAQLSQAWRQWNSNSVPPSALLKASMLNTAEDLGNPGPDFRFGWGRINALRAVQVIENERYFTGTVSQNDSLLHTIDLPANVKEFRVMLYWADKAGVPNAAKALVNNLDLRLITPSGSSFLPWVLDPTPSPGNLNSPAVRGVDTLNNAEQVTLSNPAAGIYTVNVSGTAIPFGPQTYWIVYEWYTDEIVVTYPMGGEGFVPGETELIRWDPVGVSGTYTIDYTVNNGSTWTNIVSNLPNNTRHFAWTVPANITGQARIRVTAGSVSGQSEGNFSIIGLPTNLTFGYICPTELGITWNPVTGADGYIVYRLGNMYMDSIGTTSTTNFIVTGTVTTDEDWFSVAPIGPNGLRGRRMIAVSKPIDTTFGCLAAPGANFTATSLEPCINQPVTLEDRSLNLATNWQWSISPASFTYVNGTNDTSQNPQVEFNALTSYNIQLIAGNQFGADTLSRTGYIQVSNGQLLPVTEGFVTASLPSGWDIINPDNARTWQFRTGSGPNNQTTGMAWINFYNYNTAGQIDELLTPIIDLTTGVAAPFLYFDVAYARYSTTLYDGLRIEVSTDCGNTYIPTAYFKENLDLATAGTQTGAFTPNNPGHWRRDSVDLSPYLGNNIRLKFVGINGYGNNLYITNVEVNSTTGVVAAMNISSERCVGDSLLFDNLSTGNINTYLWDFGTDANPPTANSAGPHQVVYSSAGSKTVSLTVDGPNGPATATQNLMVAEFPLSNFSYTSNATTIEFLSNSPNATSYFWDFGDGNTSTDPNPTHNYLLSAGYEVRLITSNTCNSDTSMQLVAAFATSVAESGAMRAMVYPNPGKGLFKLRIDPLEGPTLHQFEIRDMQGRLLRSEWIETGRSSFVHSFDASDLAAGSYFVILKNGIGQVQLPLIITP
ncbi:MAG: S8 family serine peptidase [Bacteroidia bacterium]